jgi:hypothetical protein
MSLERLTVVHARKVAREGGVIVTPDVLFPSAFPVETCLRRMWISVSASSTAQHRLASSIGAERYVGVEAYEFLLRTACGLESAIPGESDVFGQLKESWQSFRKQSGEIVAALEPLVQRLFEDVKHIRSRHLTNLGAATYGSLVRTLLGQYADAPTLLIGAGQMARAVLPYLPGRPLYVSNRTVAHAQCLLDDVGSSLPSASAIEVVEPYPDAELALWRTAHNVILCIPAASEFDTLRVRAWGERSAPHGRVLHLGILSATGTQWQSISTLATLADLFALQSANQDHRQLQFKRAIRECRERSRLRELGGPISLAHGWEDLSLFANIA